MIHTMKANENMKQRVLTRFFPITAVPFTHDWVVEPVASSLRSLNSSRPRMTFPAALFPDPVRPNRTSLNSSEESLEKKEDEIVVGREGEALEEDEQEALVLEKEEETPVDEDETVALVRGEEE